MKWWNHCTAKITGGPAWTLLCCSRWFWSSICTACRPCGGQRMRSAQISATVGFWAIHSKRKHRISPRWVIISDTAFHSDSVPYAGVAGQKYYAVVIFFAKNSSGSDTRSYTTSITTAKWVFNKIKLNILKQKGWQCFASLLIFIGFVNYQLCR